jgi:hypothetical protein
MIVEPLSDEKEWEEFVADSRRGTFFHTLKWKRILEESFGFKAYYLAIRDSDRNLVGICPFVLLKKARVFKVLDSLPSSDFAGPLIKEEHAKEAAGVLKDYLRGLSARTGIAYASIRFPEANLCEYLDSRDSRVDTSHGTMNLDLAEKPADLIWNSVLKTKQRQRIRLYEKEGFQSKEAESVEDLNIFYELYHKNMNYIGASPYPYAFFKQVWDCLYPDHFNILLMVKGGECIGAQASFLYTPRKAAYQTYLGLDRNVQHHGPLYNSQTWELIKWAEKNGYRYVSLGSTPSDPSDPHHHLKTKLGAEFNQDYYLYLPFDKKLFLLRESGVRLIITVKDWLPKSLQRRLLK